MKLKRKRNTRNIFGEIPIEENNENETGKDKDIVDEEENNEKIVNIDIL